MSETARLRGEIFCGAALAITGVSFAYASLPLPAGEPGVPGPGAIPLALGGLMATLGALAALRSWLRTKQRAAAPFDWRAALAMVMLALAALFFETAGFLIVSAVFLSIGFRYLGGVNWLRSLSVAIAFTVAVYAIFVTALGVALPAGLLAPVLGG